MARISSQLKEEITKLSKKDLEKLILKAATMHQTFQDYLLVNHIDLVHGKKELFYIAKSDLNNLMVKNYKGFSEELRMANMLAACNKRINELESVYN